MNSTEFGHVRPSRSRSGAIQRHTTCDARSCARFAVRLGVVNTRQLVSRFGTCSPQPTSDWQGDIPLPDEIARFYQEVGPLGERGRKGYEGVTFPGHGNDIYLVPLARLWKEQASYRWDGRTGEPIDEWPSQWIVLAWEGVDAYIFDDETKSMLFALSGGWPDDVHPIGGGPAEVVGALALFRLRYEEAGDDALTADYELRPEWVESVRKELIEEFGPAGEGVVKVAIEI